MMQRLLAGLACAALTMPVAAQQEAVITQIYGTETRIVEHILRIEQAGVSRSNGTDARIDQLNAALRRMEERDARADGHAGARLHKAGITSAWRVSAGAQEPALVKRALELLERANFAAAEVTLREHEAAASAQWQEQPSESTRPALD